MQGYIVIGVASTMAHGRQGSVASILKTKANISHTTYVTWNPTYHFQKPCRCPGNHCLLSLIWRWAAADHMVELVGHEATEISGNVQMTPMSLGSTDRLAPQWEPFHWPYKVIT